MAGMRDYQLRNGMTVLCWHQPNLHGVEMGLYFKGGPLYEEEESQGVSHLLEHLCLRALGGVDHDGLQHQLDRFGTELASETYPEALVFRMTALPRFFDGMLAYFLRFFADVPWTSTQIASAKQLVLRELEQAPCAPDGAPVDFDEQVERLGRMTPMGAFPRMGTARHIADLSEETIRQWQQRIFQPHNACLVLTGNFSDGMERSALDALSELKNHTSEPPFELPALSGFGLRDEASDLIWEAEDGPAEVRIAFDVDGEQVYAIAADVLAAITGGNHSSLLYQELRDNQALVADIDAFMTEYGSFRFLNICYQVRQDKLEESLRRVFTYLHRLTMYVRPARLLQTRTQFTSNNALLLDDASGLNDLAGWAWVAGDLSRADLDAQSRQFDDLTAEDLLDAAQTIFKPANLTLSVQHDPARSAVNLAPLFHQLREML